MVINSFSMDEVRFNKEISAKLPQTILAKIAGGFCGNTTGFEVLQGDSQKIIGGINNEIQN